MKYEDAYPLIAPLLSQMKERGAILTDKAVQAINLAAVDAKSRKYRELYDDNILAGVLRSCGAVTGLLESLGLEVLDVIETAHAPLPPDREYRRTYGRVRTSKKLRLHQQKAIREFGAPFPSRSYSDISPLASLQGSVSSDGLFTIALSMPAVWRAINSAGLSVNKVRRHAERLKMVEPDIETQKFIIALEGKKYSFDLFDFVAGVQMGRADPSSRRIIPCRLNIVTPRSTQLAHHAEEFEWLINKSSVSEYDIQRFLEQHPEFLLGLEYKSLHSQLTLTREDKMDLRPDFFLERLDNSFCDILDLKLPKHPLAVGSPNRRTFSASVISALGQLREYRNYFDDAANRRSFETAYDISAYKPRVQVLIGRSSGFRDFMERKALQDEFANLEIVTYDDVLVRVKRQSMLMRE